MKKEKWLNSFSQWTGRKIRWGLSKNSHLYRLPRPEGTYVQHRGVVASPVSFSSRSSGYRASAANYQHDAELDRPLKKTIANLTEITKLQKKNSQPPTLVNVAEVIREVVQDLEPIIQSTKARLETDTEAVSTIRFSQKNLRSIVYNLLPNALKYHSPERAPLVQLYCGQTDEYVMLSVRDNGLGMNLSDDSKIFGMFKRLHDHVEGSGIGLYMVKKIIENAGGNIEVESKVGEGSVFRVYFPH